MRSTIYHIHWVRDFFKEVPNNLLSTLFIKRATFLFLSERDTLFIRWSWKRNVLRVRDFLFIVLVHLVRDFLLKGNSNDNPLKKLFYEWWTAILFMEWGVSNKKVVLWVRDFPFTWMYLRPYSLSDIGGFLLNISFIKWGIMIFGTLSGEPF